MCVAAGLGLAARDTLALDLELRPHAGLGYGSTLGGGGPAGIALHAGGRVLLAANPMQVYGVEATYLRVRASDGTHEERLAVGILLEQRLWDWFNMSIGTIGYLGLASAPGNPFGIVTNLGWEPRWGPVSPFVTYRSDWIFADPTVSVSSLSAGATVRF